MRGKFRALNFHFLRNLILTLILCILGMYAKHLKKIVEYMMYTE